jgi:ubiquinone/menaquinone biosynthesis C-methylase UbiE
MDYSIIAGTYDLFESDAITLWQVGYPSVMNHLGDIRTRVVLDYGCGSGNFSRYLRDNGAYVTGIDVSAGMIEVAKRIYPGNIGYYRIDSGDLGFSADSVFDHAVANFVLCAIQDDDEIRKIIRELYRVLKPGGKFIVMNSNWEKSNGKEFVSFRLEYCENLSRGQRINAITKSNPPIVFEDYFRSIETYVRFLTDAGFTVDGVDEPLATGTGARWIDELIFPPYYIIPAKKP